MTNTSSTEAPARINCGILCSFPYPSSMRRIILGTTTAGDTAAITLPIMAASKVVIPNNKGAKMIVPAISTHAGTKHISTAGLPTFFKSDTSKERPALVRIMTNAICLISDEIFKMESSIRFSA